MAVDVTFSSRIVVNDTPMPVTQGRCDVRDARERDGAARLAVFGW
jgi:hypothetical protein